MLHPGSFRPRCTKGKSRLRNFEDLRGFGPARYHIWLKSTVVKGPTASCCREYSGVVGINA